MEHTTPSEHDQVSAHDQDAPAVNHAEAIARLMGDGVLFGRVLVRFGKEYRQTAAGIRTALDRGDSILALRLVHTLKGAAGMIEAVPLGREAGALEQLLRHPGPLPIDAVGPQLDRLDQALARVLVELDAAATSAAPARTIAAAPAGMETERDARPLQRLATLLDDGNGEAVDLVHEAASALTAQLGEQRYRQLVDAIDAFDFDGALALLAEQV